jgi:hypothetical protein
MGAEQSFHTSAQLRIAGAGPSQVRRSFIVAGFLQRRSKNAGFAHNSDPSRLERKVFSIFPCAVSG